MRLTGTAAAVLDIALPCGWFDVFRLHGCWQVLQACWLDMRAKAPGSGSGGVTLRQLESLVRLAEARARCDLRMLVTSVSFASSAACSVLDGTLMHCRAWQQRHPDWPAQLRICVAGHSQQSCIRLAADATT